MFAPLMMLSVALSANAEVIDRTARLELRVRVVEAVEGGPVIIETTLTNTTGRKLWVHKGSKQVGCSQIHELPKEWNVQGRHLCGSEGIISRPFEPGDTWHCRHVLHDDWVSPFPAGKYRLTVVWPLEDFGERRRPARTVGVPVRMVDLSIEPASPKVLTALAKRVEAKLAAVPLPKEGDPAKCDDLKPITELVLFTRHKALVPTIRQILDRCVPGTDTDETKYLRSDLIHTLLAIEPDARRKFVDALTGQSPPHYAAALLDIWRSDHANATKAVRLWYWRYELGLSIGYYHPAELPGVLGQTALVSLVEMFLVAPPRLLPPTDLRRLAAAPDFWVRALAHATFADRFDSAWMDPLLAEARQRHPAPAEKVVAPLIRDLDAADYETRAAAGRKLFALGHGVAPALQAAAEGGASEEVRQRAEAVLEKLRRQRLDLRAMSAIQSLDRQPGAAKLLAALADGPETDPVAIAARKRQTELAPRP